MLDLMPESQFLKVQGRSLPTSAKQDLPALDLCDAQQPQRCPGIVRESGIDFLLAFGIDDQQDLPPIAQWAAEDDEAVVYECVHERCVLIPLLLLAHGKPGVPVLSPFSGYYVIGQRPFRHRHLLTTWCV